MSYQFGEFELDSTACALTRRGERVHLARQPMDVLLLLASKAGELVSRSEIGNPFGRTGTSSTRTPAFIRFVLKSFFSPGAL